MTKTKLFAAAAVLTSMMVTPVLAQGIREHSHSSSQIKKQQLKHPNMGRSERRMVRDRDANIGIDRDFGDRRYGSNTGFFPLDAATGIVGGAVGTAGAIATAPFGGWNNDSWNNGYDNGYARAGSNGRYNRVGYRDSYAAVNSGGRVGAFATAPYTNPYEYSGVAAGNGWYGQSYNQRNQFVCEPGTVFADANGVRTLCQ